MDRLYTLEKKIENYIEDNNMLKKGDHVVVGVSGGADSMCLLDNLLRLREKYRLYLTVVHIHHGIRGEEADGDLAYVRDFCTFHNIEFRTFYFDIPKIAKEKHLSCEEAGRIKRYEAFEKVIDEEGGEGKIAIAHNANDNCETFLFNLFRGSGLTGLTAIHPIRDNIIRPVLCLTREEIEEYLSLKGIGHRVDNTNNEKDYTRNRIRLDVLPYITENINANASGNITKAINMLSEAEQFIEECVEEQYRKNVTEKNNINDKYYGESEVFISEKLWQQKKIIVNMVIRKAIGVAAGRLKDITAVHTEGVAGLYDKPVSKLVELPYSLVAVRKYDGIAVRKREKSNNDILNLKKEKESIIINIDNILKEGVPVEFDGKQIGFEEENVKKLSITEKKYTKWMNYDILKDTLEIRNRKAGDFMIIDSLGRKKKIKDLFIDLKLPRETRDNILLLARGSEVLWIIGYRMSEKCKVERNTEKVIRVDFSDGTDKKIGGRDIE